MRNVCAAPVTNGRFSSNQNEMASQSIRFHTLVLFLPPSFLLPTDYDLTSDISAMLPQRGAALRLDRAICSTWPRTETTKEHGAAGSLKQVPQEKQVTLLKGFWRRRLQLVPASVQELHQHQVQHLCIQMVALHV